MFLPLLVFVLLILTVVYMNRYEIFDYICTFYSLTEEEINATYETNMLYEQRKIDAENIHQYRNQRARIFGKENPSIRYVDIYFNSKQVLLSWSNNTVTKHPLTYLSISKMEKLFDNAEKSNYNIISVIKRKHRFLYSIVDNNKHEKFYFCNSIETDTKDK